MLNLSSRPAAAVTTIGLGTVVLHQAWPILLGGGIVVLCAVLVRLSWRRQSALNAS
jgi:hypothetical protein